MATKLFSFKVTYRTGNDGYVIEGPGKATTMAQPRRSAPVEVMVGALDGNPETIKAILMQDLVISKGDQLYLMPGIQQGPDILIADGTAAAKPVQNPEPTQPGQHS